MPLSDCETLHARAAMLHDEADLGRAKAEARGESWVDQADQIRIAERCETMAETIEEKLAQECLD